MNSTAVTFNDVLIQPRFSKIKSRKDVDLTSKMSDDLSLSLPIISANMASITEDRMANAIQAAGGMGIIHRFCSIEENVEIFKNCKGVVGVSIGITEGEQDRAKALLEAGANLFCIDVAHGAQQGVVDQVTWLRKQKQDLVIIAGNFATGESIREFNEAFEKEEYRPDFYKVGIGPGAACTTRLKTGVGIPQLSAIGDCHSAVPGKVIADGGIKHPGDVAKALLQGAVAVMVGSVLAGTDESSGEVLNSEGQKSYKGSASEGYGNGWKTSEGVEMKVDAKGPVELILKDFEGGLRSAFTYVGASNMEEFRKRGQLILVSPSTAVENGPREG